MKKLFAVMIVAAAMTACNDNTKSTNESKMSADTTMAPAATMDTTPAMSADTAAVKMSDTTMKK